jgi:hypothetical protein
LEGGNCVSRIVFDLERGIFFDRTKETHQFGLFDVDFRSDTSPNPLAHQWTYGASFSTLRKAINGAKKFRGRIESPTSGKVSVRVVNALNGEVLWDGD